MGGLACAGFGATNIGTDDFAAAHKPCRMRSPVPALMTGGLRPPLPILVLLPQLGMG